MHEEVSVEVPGLRTKRDLQYNDSEYRNVL
jgi:hypothetical protein